MGANIGILWRLIIRIWELIGTCCVTRWVLGSVCDDVKEDGQHLLERYLEVDGRLVELHVSKDGSMVDLI